MPPYVLHTELAHSEAPQPEVAQGLAVLAGNLRLSHSPVSSQLQTI